MKKVKGFLEVVNVELSVYSECKYTASAEAFDNRLKVQYKIREFEVVDGLDALEIEADTDEDGIDDNHEYLVLHLADGETATFRNSYVDMMLISA